MHTPSSESKTINAYYNGVFSPREAIAIPLTDRAIFFGDGIYDAAIGSGGDIFMLEDHLDRFYSNIDAMDIPLQTARNELKEILFGLIEYSKYDIYFLYFQASRASEERLHAYPKAQGANLLITITKIPLPNPEKVLELTLTEDNRHTLCNIKSLNLLAAVLASHKADMLGKDEAVFHRDGIITECAHSNIHILKDDKLITHPLDKYILPGIARKHLLSVCKKLNIQTEERIFDIEELKKADEVIVTSSSKLALRVKAIDSFYYKIYDESTGHKICKEMFRDFMALSHDLTNK